MFVCGGQAVSLTPSKLVFCSGKACIHSQMQPLERVLQTLITLLDDSQSNGKPQYLLSAPGHQVYHPAPPTLLHRYCEPGDCC